MDWEGKVDLIGDAATAIDEGGRSWEGRRGRNVRNEAPYRIGLLSPRPGL